jgi:hypothetical protein
MTARTGVVVKLGTVVRTPAGPAPIPGDPVEALRRRLAGPTAREHVVLDFLADDLREAREALAVLNGYLGRIEGCIADPEISQQKLLGLALGGGPIDRIEYLAEVLANVRRRMAQVAARM